MPGEVWLLLFVNGLRAPWLDPIARFVTEWGLYAFPLALAIVLARTRARDDARSLRDGWLAFLFSLFASETLLKPLIGRARPTASATLREQLHVLGSVPPPTNLGMPSGTATACMAGATWIALRHGPRWGAVAVAGALMISTTRLYVGVHYPTDLVAGWALGCVTALGVDRLTRWADAR